jgi:hypothetical protein
MERVRIRQRWRRMLHPRPSIRRPAWSPASVTFVDLRGTLSQGAGYKDDWANELHPTKSGFRAVAARIAARI